ncbi:MAG TPA: hypothetical protein VJ947_04095, partial [Pseudohaliea sp.]|nr:hypothetical protein [Pseudohaliea sp.]
MRFVAGLLGVAVTTGVFMLTALIYLKSVGPALDEIGRELQHDMLPMARLQLEIERAAMPANDFLITGDISERTNFAAAQEKVNALFTQLMEEAPVTHPAEAALVARA